MAEVHPLIKSCVFHYEFEFIHPFADGNGRMGRMWQTLLLYQWKPVFGWLPIETLIRERQEEYYKVLGECDNSADSGKFIEFILTSIYDALYDISKTNQPINQPTDQPTNQITDQPTNQADEKMERLLACMGKEALSTKELMELLGLKHRPTFRKNYLLPALKLGYVEMTMPDTPNDSRQRYRRRDNVSGCN